MCCLCFGCGLISLFVHTDDVAKAMFMIACVFYISFSRSFNFVNATLEHHLQVTTELILRDRDHPSVVMWSLANEPNSALKVSEDYFQ